MNEDLYEAADVLVKNRKEKQLGRNSVATTLKYGEPTWASEDESRQEFHSWTLSFSEEWEQLRYKLNRIGGACNSIAWTIGHELRRSADRLDKLNFIC